MARLLRLVGGMEKLYIVTEWNQQDGLTASGFTAGCFKTYAKAIEYIEKERKAIKANDMRWDLNLSVDGPFGYCDIRSFMIDEEELKD